MREQVVPVRRRRLAGPDPVRPPQLPPAAAGAAGAGNIGSSTRSTSSKLRPALIGQVITSFTALSGPMTNTERMVALPAALRSFALPEAFGVLTEALRSRAARRPRGRSCG